MLLPVLLSCIDLIDNIVTIFAAIGHGQAIQQNHSYAGLALLALKNQADDKKADMGHGVGDHG